jgi:hypothetical protein
MGKLFLFLFIGSMLGLALFLDMPNRVNMSKENLSKSKNKDYADTTIDRSGKYN